MVNKVGQIWRWLSVRQPANKNINRRGQFEKSTYKRAALEKTMVFKYY